MEEFFFEVGNGEQNLRIDKYLAQKLPDSVPFLYTKIN